MGRKKSEGEEAVNVRIAADVVEMARHVAAARRTSLSEVVSELLRGPVETAYLAVVEDLARKVRSRAKPPGGKSGKIEPGRS